jgi:S-disulfanyl-L-cysteine oxidoreductase SoxD
MSIAVAWPATCGLSLLLALGALAAGQEPEAGDESAGASPASVWDGVYTVEQAERGAALYATGCGECHGAELAGDDMSPPLVGADFRSDWDGLSVGDLFERIRISMPDGDPKRMTSQEKADVLAFVFASNGFPAGETELASTARLLRPIAFVAIEP